MSQSTIPREREFALPLTQSGTVRLSCRLRETYLSPDVEEVVVQGRGDYLSMTASGARGVWDIRFPLVGYRASRPYRRAVVRWGVDLSRWLDPQASDSEITSDPPGVLLTEGSDDDREVRATVAPVEEEVDL